MTKSILLAGTAVAVAIIAPGGVSWAQEDEAEQAASDRIVVTARKQEEALVDVPISLSAFSDATIADRLIDDITEISDFTPGFQQQQAFGRNGDRPVIRGTSNILVAEGKVGFFIDGIPLTGDTSGLDLTNLERVEVIKGPQSAVFGRGTLSGAVNFVTRRPGDEHEFRLEGTVGNFDRYEAIGSWSGPITSWLSGYANLSFDTFGGDYDNNEDGGKLNETETLAASGYLYFDPTENISGAVRFIYQDVDDGHFAIDLQDSSFNNSFDNSRGYFTGQVPPRLDEDFGLNTDDILNPGVERETRQILADLNYDIGGSGYVLSYLGGLTAQEEVSGVDQTYDETAALLVSTPFFPGGPSVCTLFFANAACGATAFHDTSASRRDVVSHEVRFSTPTDQRIRASVGYFYGNERRKGVAEYLEATEFGLDTLGDRTSIENNAIFGSIEADITPRLTGSVEIRYSEDEITTRGQAYMAGALFDDAFLAGLFNPNPAQVIGDTNERSATFDATLPRVTLRYAASDNINLYAQYSEGNAPGGFNPEDAPQTTVEEEELTNIEVGVKGYIPDLNLDFAFSAFSIDYENQGLTQTYETALGGFDSYSANIGKTEIRGLEFEGTADVTDNFTLAGTVGYIDAEITDGTITDQGILLGGADCLDSFGTTGVFTPTPECVELASIVGQTPPLVSRWQVTLSPRYAMPTGYDGWEAFAGADVIYRSSFFAQVHNLAEVGASARLNLQAGLTNGRYRVVAWGENVTDHDTPLGILRYVDFQAPTNANTGQRQRAFGITPPPKAAYGVTASVRF